KIFYFVVQICQLVIYVVNFPPFLSAKGTWQKRFSCHDRALEVLALPADRAVFWLPLEFYPIPPTASSPLLPFVYAFLQPFWQFSASSQDRSCGHGLALAGA